MSINWNSYGNHSLNGVPYQSPPGFQDRAFDYVFPDPTQFTPGEIVVAAGQTVSFSAFTDQGSLFLWSALELPPPALPDGYTPTLYKASVQIYLNEEAVFADALNNVTGFGNQSVPLPILSVRYLRPGTLIRIEVTNWSGDDYYNFAIVMRGLRRYQRAQGVAA